MLVPLLQLRFSFFLNLARGVRTPNSTTPKNHNIKCKSQVPTGRHTPYIHCYRFTIIIYTHKIERANHHDGRPVISIEVMQN